MSSGLEDVKPLQRLVGSVCMHVCVSVCGGGFLVFSVPESTLVEYEYIVNSNEKWNRINCGVSVHLLYPEIGKYVFSMTTTLDDMIDTPLCTLGWQLHIFCSFL